MFRGRSLRTRGWRGRQQDEVERVSLDFSRDPAVNIREILTHIVVRQDVSKAKKLGYLNGFCRLCCKTDAKTDLGYSIDEVLSCLRLALLHETKEVRAACLRALRYLLRDADTFDAILRLRIDYLVVRCLDISLDNEIERIHAIRLMRKVLEVCPERFPSSFVNPLIAIGNNGTQERDRMVRVSLATLSELAIHNTNLVWECGGLGTILHNVLDCHQQPRISESLLATVLYLLNHPRTRHFIKPNVDLEQMLAPFTDCHFRYSAESSDHSASDDKENRFSASKMAIATIIRSWPGMIRLCKPDSSGLQSLLGVLYLPNMDTRKGIMDILFDVFFLSVPKWTNDFNEALLSSDPSQVRESWKLVNGFVSVEGRDILPHTSKIRSNLIENHLSLLLVTFISAGLLEALVEVITTSEDHVSVRATILLGEILHLANTIIPHECSQHSHCLPTLIALAASFDIDPKSRQRASISVTCLHRLHAMKKRGPVPSSLFLDQILQQAASLHDESPTQRPLKFSREKLMQYLTKDADDLVAQAVKNSMVLSSKESDSWDWDIIGAVLKWPDENLKKLQDQNYLKFIKKLLEYFKPTNKLYSEVDYGRSHGRKLSVVGCQLVDYLQEADETEGGKLISDWLSDIGQCLTEVCTERAPLDAQFSPSHLMQTLSQNYFLFIGRFSHTCKGEKILEKAGIFQCLLELVETTSHDTYIKLVVSCLDYSRDGLARIVLSKALTATSEVSRMYTASYMRVLLRAKVPFLSNWGMELLVTQLYDQSKSVGMEALSVIDEACEEEVNLLTLIRMRPSVLHLGDRGAMLLARFLSTPSGFKFLTDVNYINNELERWRKSFNEKYVHIVEEQLNEALTTYEKSYDGAYTRRSGKRRSRREVYTPIHLYGQMVQHKAGYQYLEGQSYIGDLFDTLRFQALQTDKDILRLKAALWAVGHIGTSSWGLSMLQDEDIIPSIIKLAEECGVFSVRGTAFFVIGLISCTRHGADIVKELGWEAMRHNRTEIWPVIEESDAMQGNMLEVNSSASSLSLASSAKSDKDKQGTSTPQNSFYGVESPSSISMKQMFFIDEDIPEDTYANNGATENHIPSQSGDDDVMISSTLTESATDNSIQEMLNGGNGPAGDRTSPSHRKVRSLSVERELVTAAADHSHFGYKSSLKRIERGINSEGGQTDPPSMTSSLIVPSSKEKMERVVRIRSVSTGEIRHDRTTELSGTKQRSSSLREYRPNTGSETRNKSHSDSLNTDSNTSGVSSYDSGPRTILEHVPLSPIPSSNSVSTVTNKLSPSETDDQMDVVHPSDTLRKLSNLRRVPSMKRRYSNPVLGHLSPIKTLDGKMPFHENVVSYTTARNAQGYAALRSLQRQRSRSSENEPDLGVLEEGQVSKTCSLDFRLVGKSRRDMAEKISPKHAMNTSFSSLQDLECPPSPIGTLSHSTSKSSFRKSSTGTAEYTGLCLPVDVNMLFQVSEGEDLRCHAMSSHGSESEYLNEARSRAGSSAASRLRSISQLSDECGLEFHSSDNCLACHKVKKASDLSVIVQLAETEQDVTDRDVSSDRMDSLGRVAIPRETMNASPVPTSQADLLVKGNRPRVESLTERDQSGSVTSTTSTDSTLGKKVSVDSGSGRILIRKECLRFIVSLGSSVGVKSAEQGLLMLKQKFPEIFNDVCLYSEISFLLAHYSFRLSARRFIQELFQDMNFSQLFEEPRQILGLSSDALPPSLQTEKTNSAADSSLTESTA